MVTIVIHIRKIDCSFKIMSILVSTKTSQGSFTTKTIIWFFVVSVFYYMGFLSRPVTNHGTAREGEGYFNSSLPLPPASQALRH